MKTTTFDLEEKRLKKEISKRKAKIVLLQLPEGLKAEGPRLASIIEDAGALAIVSADPCYGACDLAIPDAESLGADLLVHYGHSLQIKQEKTPTIYMEALAKNNEEEARNIASKIRNFIENIETQPKLIKLLEKKIDTMKKRIKKNRVAVRSSGITEDMATAAFAGQFETYLNVPLDSSSVIKYILTRI